MTSYHNNSDSTKVEIDREVALRKAHEIYSLNDCLDFLQRSVNNKVTVAVDVVRLKALHKHLSDLSTQSRTSGIPYGQDYDSRQPWR